MAPVLKAVLLLSAVPPHILTLPKCVMFINLSVSSIPNVPAICADAELKITCNLVNYDNYSH